MTVARKESWAYRLPTRIPEMPAWARFVGVVVMLGSVGTAWAVVDVTQHGIARPFIFGGGIVAVCALSYLHLTVVQKGEVLEAIDLTEAPVITLALALPPGEAILAVVAGSILSQLQPRRSLAKKAFNVGIRALGMECLELTAGLLGHRRAPASGWPIPVGLTAAAIYTAVGAIGITAVVFYAQGGSFRASLAWAWRPRLVAWLASAVIGTSAATVAVLHPAALAGVSAALALVWYSTKTLHREQRERRRLECLIEATTLLLDAADEPARDAATLDAAQKLLLWRDVALQDGPPATEEFGVELWTRDTRSRWLVARPRSGGDAWSDEDRRVLDAIGAASLTATERARMQQELIRHARVDALTGLANRREFDARLDAALAAETELGVVLLDLDSFKPVNDSLGHEAGDELLRIIATRITSSLRTTDLAARIGGDEFVVLLPGATRSVAERVAADICAAIGEPLQIEGWQLAVSASAGAAVAPGDGSHRPELMRCADQKMYATKRTRPRRTFLAVGDSSRGNAKQTSSSPPLR